MQLELWMRGDIRSVQRFIQDLQGKYLKFTFQGYNGKEFIPDSKYEYMWPISVRIAPL